MAKGKAGLEEMLQVERERRRVSAAALEFKMSQTPLTEGDIKAASVYRSEVSDATNRIKSVESALGIFDIVDKWLGDAIGEKKRLEETYKRLTETSYSTDMNACDKFDKIEGTRQKIDTAEYYVSKYAKLSAGMNEINSDVFLSRYKEFSRLKKEDKYEIYLSRPFNPDLSNKEIISLILHPPDKYYGKEDWIDESVPRYATYEANLY